MLPRATSTNPAASRLRGALAVLSTLWLLGACCDPSGTCVADANDDAGPSAELSPIATPGCDVATIEDRGGAVTCAQCAADAGATEICGSVEVARCESREDSRGEPCSYCATAFGEILYDSCFSDDPVAFVNCERSEQPTDPDAPGQPADLVCETCTDAVGVVVAQSCEPSSDECHEDSSSGVSCRICTRGDDVVVRNCQQPDIAPRSCEAYGDVATVGRCVDCYGDDDELLSHSCTLAEDPFISCSESVTPEGLRCFSCFDANGAQVERYCEEIPSELQQCALLDYSEQSCVVCVDQLGDAALLDCDRTDCPAGAECLPPPECTLEFGPSGELCRTCPTDAGALEQACVFETNLVCGQVFDEPSGTSCLVCSDLGTGVEVYRRCDNNGSLPPTCFFIENAVNEVCEVCTDSQTGELVYADCPSQTCSDIGDFALFSSQGTSLFVGDQPAVASCSQCALAADGVTVADDFRASCSLLADCPVDLTNPDAACEGTVTFRLRPILCDNPWEIAGFFGSPESYDELLQVLAFALDSSLAAVAVQHATGTPANASCTDSCGCARGGSLLELVIRPSDAALAVELFSAVIEGCVSDADCSGGDACRADGACG